MIALLLATRDGAPWLPEQLASIAGQTRTDWQLWVSDDASRDGTRELLQQAAAGDSRIRLLPARGGEPGAAANFGHLLASLDTASVEAVFLADQDDVWRRDKLERLGAELARAVLAFSDVRLIDEQGRPGRLRFPLIRFRPPVSLADALADNPAAGCTMGFRPELLALASPLPAQVVNHDWWLLVCALCLGPVTVLDEPLVSYRQHPGNEVGVARGLAALRGLPRILRRQSRLLGGKPAAVAELVRRLEGRGLDVPPELRRYLHFHAARSRRRRAWYLLRGHYAPRRRSLRLLQVLALLLPGPGR